MELRENCGLHKVAVPSVNHQHYKRNGQGVDSLPKPWEKDRHYEAFLDYEPARSWPDNPEFNTLVDRIYHDAKIASLIKVKSPKSFQTATKQRKVELASLLWHCHLVFGSSFVSTNPELFSIGMYPTYSEGHPDPYYVEFTVYPYIKISMNKTNYQVNSRKNPLKISDNVTCVLKLLHASGFVELQRGFFDNTVGSGKETRFRPCERLDVELYNLPTLKQEAFPSLAPSIFRAAVKQQGKAKVKKNIWREVELSIICPKLIEDATLIDRFNRFVDTQQLRLQGSRNGILWVPMRRAEFAAIHEAKRYIQNIYHINEDGRITYGRMHGGFWQNMPSKCRHLIRINHEPVIILDFKAMILSIVASDSGKDLMGDPYDIDVGLGNEHKKVQRSLIKSIVIISINTKSRIEAASAVLKDHAASFKEAFGKKLTQKDVLGFIDKIVKTHPFLEAYLFKKLGKDIFAIDADIARGIIRRCLDANKLALPIHDGFVVAESDKEFLRSAMEASWKDLFDTDIGIDEE